MSVNKISRFFFSNKLFALIVVASVSLIVATTVCYSAFPRAYDTEPDGAAATILGILVGIFVLFFASMQILYSVNDIPRELLRRYTLITKESFSLVGYFAIAILNSGFMVLLDPIPHGEYLLSSSLFLGLLIITCFFFWFTKRITAEEILKQMTLKTGKALIKINKLEEISSAEFRDFHEFLRKSKGRYRYETSYCVYDSLLDGKEPSFTVLAKKKADTTIGNINVQEIEKKLSKITSDAHVKIIFEVEPTQPIPKKDPYNNMLHNHRLLTIVFEENEKDPQEDFEKAQKEFVKKRQGARPNKRENDESRDISREVRKILKDFGTGLENCFERQDYRKWTNKAENALDELKTMFVYNLKNEQVVDPLCSALETIIGDQFFALKPHIFLHVRYNLFRKIGEMFGQINEASLRKDDVRFFSNMLRLFYGLVSTAAECRNPLICDEVLKAMRYFHVLFVTTAPHAYNFGVEILVLNIRELTTSIPRGHFETENDVVQLDRFYNTTFQKGVDTAFEVVKDYLNWYNEDKLHHEIYLRKQIQLLIDFMPFYKDRPQDYFSEPHEYLDIKRRLDHSVSYEQKSLYELATKKAQIVAHLRKKLQKRIMELAIYAVALYREKEVGADVLWKIALPAARSSCYEHGLESFFTAQFNDYGFERDTQDLLGERDIHPAGAHELRRFNLNIFWIIFNIYLGKGHFFPTQAQEFLKRRLLQGFEDIDKNLWPQALNMDANEFEKRISQYSEFANKDIKTTDRQVT